jgi:seryl-tRNA(Sec) selenium transferase
MELIAAGVRGIPGVSARLQYPQANGREVPSTIVKIDAAVAGTDAHSVINALQEGEPPVCVFEKCASIGEIVFLPEALRSGEAEIIARLLREILEARVDRSATR